MPDSQQRLAHHYILLYTMDQTAPSPGSPAGAIMWHHAGVYRSEDEALGAVLGLTSPTAIRIVEVLLPILYSTDLATITATDMKKM